MKSTKILLRKCVACNNMIDKNNLFRLVRINGKVEFDASGKADGRGAYVCKSKKCIDMAVKKKGFNRSLKTPVSEEIYNLLYLELDNGDR